jgi:hypothetical protein
MKHILLLSILLSPLAPAISAEPRVVVKRVIIPNGIATASMFDTASATAIVAQSRAHLVTRLGTALQFEFQDEEGTPVTVSNFKASVGKFTLVRNGTANTGYTNTPLGAYHPVGQGSPDYFVFNGASDVSPPYVQGVPKYVAGYNGDNSGTLIPLMTKFVLLDFPIPLGTESNKPLLTAAGQYYVLSYDWTFSYEYGATSYTYTIPPSETEVSIVVVNDSLLTFDEEQDPMTPNTAYGLRLQLSYNLANWVPAPTPIPHPLPTNIANLIALVPSTTTVAGLPANDKRFYRYERFPLPSFP